MTLIASLTRLSVDGGILSVSAVASSLESLRVQFGPSNPGMFHQVMMCWRTHQQCVYRMDLYEDSGNNTVTATFELPGLKKEDVSIDVHNGRLTVSGETKLSSDYDENGYAVRERKYGKISRTLQLPQGIKVSCCC